MPSMSQSYNQVAGLTAYRAGFVRLSTISGLSGRYASARTCATQRHQRTPSSVDPPSCPNMQLGFDTQTLVFLSLRYR